MRNEESRLHGILSIKTIPLNTVPASGWINKTYRVQYNNIGQWVLIRRDDFTFFPIFATKDYMERTYPPE